jgi:hypothetical protein
MEERIALFQWYDTKVFTVVDLCARCECHPPELCRFLRAGFSGIEPLAFGMTEVGNNRHARVLLQHMVARPMLQPSQRFLRPLSLKQMEIFASTPRASLHLHYFERPSCFH